MWHRPQGAAGPAEMEPVGNSSCLGDFLNATGQTIEYLLAWG